MRVSSECSILVGRLGENYNELELIGVYITYLPMKMLASWTILSDFLGSSHASLAVKGLS